MSDVRPLPTITSVDGVPLVWADGPAPFTGALMFRVGRADETLPNSGLTHLVEHLALYPIGRQPFQYNGSVEENVTMLYASGERDEVVAFLRRCAENLAALPLERLNDEKRVLGVEAASSGGLYPQLLSYRYGAAGYGLMAFQELGLRSLEAQHVADWSARFFTRGNAVAWLSGPPDGLSLPLAAGPRHPAPDPEPLERLELPTQTWHRESAVAMSFEGQRSMALNTGLSIAADRVHQRLRREAGVTYSPEAVYHALTADRAHLLLSTDCEESNAAPVRESLLAILEDLRQDGPEQAELDWNHSMLVRQFADPSAVLGQLHAAARRELIGGDPVDEATLVRDSQSLTPQMVAAAIGGVMATMVVSVPYGTPKYVREGVRDYVVDLTDPAEGTRFAPRAKWKSLAVFDELIVGGDAVTYRPRPADNALTFRFAECVAAIEGQGSSLTMVSRTGRTLRLSPDRYEEGDLALDSVRRRLPAGIIVPLDDSGRKVHAVAAQKLAAEHQSPLVDDLESLVGLLAQNEQLINVAEARRGRFQGLLATTDVRLMFIFNGDSETDFREVPLDAATDVSVKGLRKNRLCLTAANEELEFSDLWPRERLSEIHSQLLAAV